MTRTSANNLAIADHASVTRGTTRHVADSVPLTDSASVSTSTVRHVSEELSLTGHLDMEFRPADQARDWKRRWKEIERKAAELQEPRSDGMSGNTLQAARDELHTFYISCYHLKDSLKHEASTTGVSKREVEDAITADSALSLVGDLANLDKHAALDTKKYQPRSGHVPTIGAATGSASTSGEGWRLNLPIVHNKTILDGLTVAQQAVDAWRGVLTGWGLL
jgi:hypothetical protein